jgi:phage-related protein
MTLLDRIDFGTSIIKLDGLAAGMILLSISALILSFAVRSMSKLNWDDLTRGMVGVGVGLALMVAAMVGLTYAGPGSIIAAAGMIELSIGLTALYVAVKLFSTLGWAELAKGLAGIGGGLLILTAAMSEMPASSVLTGFGLIEFSIGLIILYKAVQLFSTLGWAELGKGLAGIGAMLLLIGAAMQEMPITMPITAAGLVILSVALTIMAEAVKLMGSLDLGTLAKGIGAFTVMLLVLSAATEAMSGTAAGALSLLVVSFALTILANVLEKIGNLSIAQIVTGLLAIAATLAILGISAAIMQPLIPALLGLGVALSLIGASFALVGAGAFLLAKAFETMAKAGVAGAQAMVDSIKILVTAIPDILRAIFTGILNFAEDLLNSMPLLIKLMTTVLDALLDAIIQLTPKIAKALGEIITEGLKLIREKAPEYVETGLTVLLAILKGIRDNISEITTVVVEIITNFINGLSEKIEPLIDAVYNLMLSVAEGVARKTGELTTAFIPIGLAFFDGLMTGLKNGVGQIFDFFTELPGRILDIIKTALGISSPSTKFMEIGANIIAGLLQGLTDAITGIFTFFTELPGKIIGWMGDILGKMIPVGADFIIGILKGIAQKELDIINWFTELPGKIIGWIGDVTGRLKQVGIDFIVGLISGFTEKIWDLFNWLIGLPALIVSYIPNPLNILKQVGEKIIDGLVDGIGGSLYKVAKKVQEIEPIIHGNKGPPAHDAVMLVHAGQLIMQGLLNGLQSGMKPIKKWLGNVNLGDHLNTNISDANVDGISSVLKKMVDELSDISEFNPIITPVLDLTKVQNDSQKLERMMRLSSISIGTSIDQARIISKTNEIDKPAEPQIQPVSSEVKFEQNIYSPTTLSAIDIYRGTKSQIAIAKEELNI